MENVVADQNEGIDAKVRSIAVRRRDDPTQEKHVRRSVQEMEEV